MARQREHLSALASAVAIQVVPEREVTQFGPAQFAVPVVIERLERFIPVLPERPEGGVPEPLERGRNLTAAGRVVHEPASLVGDPRPRALAAAAIGIERDGRVQIDDGPNRGPVRQRYCDWSNGARQSSKRSHPLLKLVDLRGIALLIEQRDQIARRLLRVEAFSELRRLRVLFFGPRLLDDAAIRCDRSGLVS
jgi:hypothetical protein